MCRTPMKTGRPASAQASAAATESPTLPMYSASIRSTPSPAKQTGVVGVLLVERGGAHLRDPGGPGCDCRRRHAASHVGFRVACVPGGDGDPSGGARVLLPPAAQPDGPQSRRIRPEVVADDDLGAHSQVVSVDLFDDIGELDVRGGRPRFEPVGGSLEDIGAAPLQLRAGPSVHQQRLTGVQPVRYRSRRHRHTSGFCHRIGRSGPAASLSTSGVRVQPDSARVTIQTS